MKANTKDINGVLILNKPIGVSSNRVLQQVRRLFQAKKAGHTGSLDPLASGVLPICFGEATKFSSFLLDANKTYTVSAKLGAKTTTGDLEGELLNIRPVPKFSKQEILSAVTCFLGASKQVPSMYSALKHNGQPLYKLARRNITIERPERDIYVYSFDLLDQTTDTLTFSIECSKGTYIRNLIEDLGEKLGCGAHIIALQRTKAGGHGIEQAVCMEELQNTADLARVLLPVDSLLSVLPKIIVSETEAIHLIQGKSLRKPIALSEGMVSLKDNNGNFIGIGKTLSDNIRPYRMMSSIYQEQTYNEF